MSLKSFAEQELSLIGLGSEAQDEMDVAMRDHILYMVDQFAAEGHSGFSASYALGILTKLLAYEPLTALTGEDSEWTVLDYGDEMVAQNKRCSHVFKRRDGTAYDSQAIIWYDWYVDENGDPYKSHFTSSESSVEITFPYIPTKEFRERLPEKENE